MKIAKDKYLHFTCCMLIALIATAILGLMSNWYVGALAGLSTAMGTGVGKEYGDCKSPGNKWDWKDILADFIGAIVGALIGMLVIFI